MSFFLNSYFIRLTASSIPIIYYDLIYDQYWDNTVLLLRGDYNIKSEIIIDNSSNLFPLTNYGLIKTVITNLFSNACEGSYFNGTSNYITFPTIGVSQFSFSGDFTIEAFIYKSLSSDRGLLISTGGNITNTQGLFFGDDPTTNKLLFFSFVNNSTIATSTSVIPLNQWVHVAVSRSSGTLRLFINGALEASATNTQTFAAAGVNAGPGGIGAYSTNQQSFFQKGFMSNIRFVKGSALYASAFTPPTSHLTLISNGGATPSTLPTPSQVSLLLLNDISSHQNNTFLDSSTNKFTITRTGTPTQGSFSPYALNGVAYSPTIHGGGAYFPGVNSNHLSVPSNAAFNFTSGTFTVECWIRVNSVVSGTFQQIVGNYNGVYTGWTIQIDNKVYVNFSGDDTDISGTTILQSNIWYHVAVSGSTGSYKLFLNGVQEGSTYTGATSLAGGILGIGALGDRPPYIGMLPVNGYISNLRIVNGRACYTSNFTPPTSPVTLLSNGGATPSTAPTSGQVSLLCDFTNAGIFDNAKKNVLTTVGDAKVSTSVVKYGTGAMYFDGTGDYLDIPRSSNFDFGSGNLTIEGWVNVLSIDSTFNCIFSEGGAIQVYSQSGTIIAWFNDSDDVSSYIVNGISGPSNSVAANTWTHFAVVRNGSTFTVYVNGVAGTAATGVTQSVFYSTLPPRVGIITGSGGSTYTFNGYIDDLRITKGIARYTANFTPPTRAFPDIPYLGVFALQIDTTKTGTTTNTQFNLALRSSTSYDFNINWGDNVNESYTSSNTTGYTHTYSTPGIYTVTIAERSLGGFAGVFYNDGGDKLKLLNLLQFGGNQFGTNWSDAFQGCSNLKISATDFLSTKTQNITNLSFCWDGCAALSGFPLINTSKVTNFSYAWRGCTNLNFKNFPAIDTSSATNLEETWFNIPGLTNFPFISTQKVTNFNSTWGGCIALSSFPLIDVSKGDSFQGTWYNCQGLKSFPSINPLTGTNFRRAWYNNRSLKDFPLIQLPKATNLGGTWSYCSSLTSFPNIDFSNVTNFGNEGGTTSTGIFEGCRSISSFNISFSTTRNVVGWDRAFLWCDKLNTIPYLDYSKGTTFYATWMGPNLITSFPSNLTLSAGQDFTQAWRGMTLLSSFPDTYNFSNATNFSYAWYGCTSLGNFPNLSATNVTNFTQAWLNCTSLSSFTLNLLRNATDFSASWQGCTSLRNFELSAPAVTNLGASWLGCVSLTGFNLIAPNVTTVSYAWYNCTSFVSFPVIDLPKATNYDSTWRGCNKLREFPLINTLSATTLSQTWMGCTSLSSFPLIDTKNVTNFNSTWQMTDIRHMPNIDTSKATSMNQTWWRCYNLISLQPLSTSNVTSFSRTWENCGKLSSFPMIDTSKVTNFTSAWNQCYSLSAFPMIDTSKGTDFETTWHSLFNLSAFPALDFSNATKIAAAWVNCTGLLSFPWIDTRKVNEPSNGLFGTWANCNKLTNFPAINLSAHTGSLHDCWSNCTSLTSFPYIDISNSTGLGYRSGYSYYVYGAWGNCRKLVTFPALSTGKVTSFNRTWMDCVSLTAFPLIDTLSGTDFTSTWQNCISLSASEFPTLNMSKMTIGTNCFNGVKLTTTSYSSLLTSLCATNFNTAVTFHGGNSTFNTVGSAAKVFLTKPILSGGRGWTINDGGYQAGT